MFANAHQKDVANVKSTLEGAEYKLDPDDARSVDSWVNDNPERVYLYRTRDVERTQARGSGAAGGALELPGTHPDSGVCQQSAPLLRRGAQGGAQ